MRNMILIFLQMLFLTLINLSYGDNYNLIGDAGQAYAIEVYLGHPAQKLNVLVDTGSTTLAVASYPHQDISKHFISKNSTTLYDLKKEVQAKYSQGRWVGDLVSDYVKFPSLAVPEIRSNISLIKKSQKFFMNGSGWQGLLGLAYLPVGAWGDNVVVESWLDSVERDLSKPMSFQLELCGVKSRTNATHYGKFAMINDYTINKDNPIFRTPILRKRWYEVGVLSVRVITNFNHVNLNYDNRTNKVSTSVKKDLSMDLKCQDLDKDMCQKLNIEKSILDSGTTNIRLPDVLYRQVNMLCGRVLENSNNVFDEINSRAPRTKKTDPARFVFPEKVVDELRNAVENSTVILDNFWFHGEAACWPEPQEWPYLPWLAVDILSAESDHQYFTIEIPVQNYMRLVSAQNSSNESGAESAYCYKLGLEAGGKETVLGYTAMEGLQVLFNRSAGWIGWRMSDCGPNSRITGPYNTSKSLISLCQLTKPVSEESVSIKAAQWTLCALSIIAGTVLVYLLAPCVKNLLFKPARNPMQISLSQAALVEQEST